MGRTYWFECSKCEYRAKVSGRAERGMNFFVQTIVCRDCRELYDAVTRLKVPDEPALRLRRPFGLPRTRPSAQQVLKNPPNFDAVLNRLPNTGVRRVRWQTFEIQCPVSYIHRVEVWNDPGRCPKCGVHLEKSYPPFRIWE
jgi:hypothetical protein